MVDAGSSGCMTFAGLRKFICEASRTRVLALLNVACHGMAGAGCSGPDFGPGGENDHLNSTKVGPCVRCISDNRKGFIFGRSQIFTFPRRFFFSSLTVRFFQHFGDIFLKSGPKIKPAATSLSALKSGWTGKFSPFISILKQLSLKC